MVLNLSWKLRLNPEEWPDTPRLNDELIKAEITFLATKKRIKQALLSNEIDYDKVERIHGMNITFVTTARTDAEALSLLTHLGMPFKAK